MKRYAIVGFGCAGYHAAKAIRACGDQSRIDVYELTNQPPANPMLTTYYAGERIPFTAVFPFGELEQIQEDLDLQLMTETTVKAVYPDEKTIETESGERLRYDRILISTGARAILPPMKGLPDPRVFLMRTMEDANLLKDYIQEHPVKKALVVGASMVGIKLAELFYQRDAEVTIADMAPFLFPLAAYESVGRELERRLTEKGMKFKWRAGIQEITPAGAAFTDGSELEADIICLCIGTRANVELAANVETVQGTDIVINRGIVVNEKMETSVSGIYAAGDCCEGNNLQTGETSIIGLWANAGYQGETAGRNMAGDSAEYHGNILHNITHYLHTDFIGLGDTRLPGRTVTFGDITGDLYIEARLDGKKLNSINMIGGKQVSGILKSWLLQRIEDETAELTMLQKGYLIKNGIPMELIKTLGGDEA